MPTPNAPPWLRREFVRAVGRFARLLVASPPLAGLLLASCSVANSVKERGDACTRSDECELALLCIRGMCDVADAGAGDAAGLDGAMSGEVSTDAAVVSISDAGAR